ncbi:hypothetical protein GQ53DRAFT_746670 [Thozetella sp. PMI_491]|nr:hypothetical protein GQ53DRAFT_746670 [Thozetella sp. PMI_491]
MATSKSPLGTAPSSGPNMLNDRGYTAPGHNSTGGYFPPQQAQQHQHQLLNGTDYATASNTLANSHIASPIAADGSSPLVAPIATRPAKFTEEWDASQRGSSIVDGTLSSHGMQRSSSFSGSAAGDAGIALSRGNTLKKKPSLRRSASMRRSSSRRSMKAGSVRSLALHSTSDQADMQSAFVCPVPINGNPTEALANRFQAWRKILKDLITYFREIQSHYEHRGKSLLKLANLLNNTSTPPGFLPSGGVDDALQILRDYNKQAISEAAKAREIEEDVILALTGLRSDLHQKIKEIKNLSGDFKSSVQKEMDQTRKAVNNLQETLGQTELNSALTTGKQDPYLLRLAVDRQLYRQIDEENYLHQAYLNLENSGRELESIVVGEIQKSYNAYAGILKRESDAVRNTVDELRSGPISMPKDIEWNDFVHRDDQFVDPEIPPRSAQYIEYPGRDHPLCQEIRAGLLERKSKYLKSYTAGWYVLSPTHLHEFKSADKTQAPVMSLYLPEQKLGSHSTEGGSSNKFILKGRQTGSMHRGHTWVFRAESHDTMMAWYEDIKALTERTPEERSNFVRDHSRSYSRSSQRSFSSDGVVDDDDEEPFTAAASVSQQPKQEALPRRPSPGGRFPSDLQVNAQRGLQVPLSPASVSSGYDTHDRDILATAETLPGSGLGPQSLGDHEGRIGYGGTVRTPMEEAPSHAAIIDQEAKEDGVNPYTSEPWTQDPRQLRGSADSASRLVPVAAQRSSSVRVASTKNSYGLATPESNMATASDEIPNKNGWANGKQVVGTAGIGSLPSGHQPHAPFGTGLEPYGSVSGRAVGVDPGNQQAFVEQREAMPSVTNSSAGQNGSAVRPSTGPRNDSVPTISSLHIPGEFPRGTPVS